MANIRKTQTRGDQTLLSNFRVDSDVQTYLKKDAETNTIKNSGTQYKAEKERHDVGIWLWQPISIDDIMMNEGIKGQAWALSGRRGGRRYALRGRCWQQQ